MGTLKRLSNIMKYNVSKVFDNSKNEDEIRDYIRKFENEIRNIKAEADSIKAETKRKKRLLNECEDSIAKMERYEKKAIESGNMSDSRHFKEKKDLYILEKTTLEEAYQTANILATKMENAERKLNNDIKVLSDRLIDIKNRENELADKKEKRNSINNKIYELENNINLKESEMKAMDEIEDYLSDNSSENDELDQLFEELENDNKEI